MSNIASISLRDAAGKRGSLPIYFDDAATFENIQDWLTVALPHLDADTDARILGATITLNATLPGGLKATATDDNRVREGANLTFNVDGSIYVNTLYVPAWKNAQFDGDDVLNTDTTGHFIYDLHHAVGADTVATPTDEYGNVNDEYVKGVRAFRK